MVPDCRGGMQAVVLLQLHWLMPDAMLSAVADRVCVAPPLASVDGPVVSCFCMSRSCSVSGGIDEKPIVKKAKQKLTEVSD